MTGIYDHVSTMICEKGEQLYPGSWMLNERLDWQGVYEYWSKYVAYCKRHAIVMGRHEEVKKWH